MASVIVSHRLQGKAIQHGGDMRIGVHTMLNKSSKGHDCLGVSDWVKRKTGIFQNKFFLKH